MAWPRDPVEAYRYNQANGASGPELILMAYDAALLGCGQRDLIKTTRALSVLRNSLDVERGPLALQLLNIYLYCADLARGRHFDEAAKILRDLRETWSRANQTYITQAL
jgi:flagellin-specific chaperone FliS